MKDRYQTIFFICSSCDFKFTLLGAQINYKIEGECPSCSGEDGELDYMSTEERVDYLTKLADDLHYMKILPEERLS